MKNPNNYLCRKVCWWEQRVEAVPCWSEFRLRWEGRDKRLHPSASEETWNMLKLILSLKKSVANVSHSSSFFQLKFLGKLGLLMDTVMIIYSICEKYREGMFYGVFYVFNVYGSRDKQERSGSKINKRGIWSGCENSLCSTCTE